MSRHSPYWLVLVGLAVLAAPANGRQCDYGIKVLDLGGGPCVVCSAAARAVNEAGQVVGFASAGDEFSSHAFIWDPVNGIQDLGTFGGLSSAACCINEAGQVAGSALTASGHNHAFFWDPADGLLDLGTLGGLGSAALAMNDAGQVVGSSDTGSAEHAFIWDAKNGMQDLGTILTKSRAVDINNNGQVIGVSYDTVPHLHTTRPFVWDSTNGLQELGTGGTGGANHINEAGLIAGWSTNALWGTPYVPALFDANSPGSRPLLLNGIFDDSCGEAVFVRDDGLVLFWQEWPGFGCAFSFGVRDPYTWPGGPIAYESPYGMSPIKITANDQILLQAEPLAYGVAYIASSPDATAIRWDALVPELPCINNLSPGDINNHGEIVGSHYDCKRLATLPYIAWPCPPDVNKDGAVNVLDLIELLLGFGLCDPPPQRCPADINKDGVVDADDVFEVLANFGGPGV